MKPCDNCKKTGYCEIRAFIEKNSHNSPWTLDKILHERYFGMYIVNAMTNDLSSFVLDCYEYVPDKEDYFVRPDKEEIRLPEKPQGKCDYCKGNCGK